MSNGSGWHGNNFKGAGHGTDVGRARHGPRRAQHRSGPGTGQGTTNTKLFVVTQTLY